MWYCSPMALTNRVYTLLDDDTLAELKLRAREADRTVAYLLRVAVDQLLNQLDPSTIDASVTIDQAMESRFGAVPRSSHPSGGLRCVPDDPYPTPS